MTQNPFDCCQTKGTHKNPNANQSENNFEIKDEKTDLKTGQSLVEEHQFRSKIEIVLESTNKNELWGLLTEQVLEDLTKFQMNKSGWKFHSIVALDIHTVGYVQVLFSMVGE